jgi:energy-converting hydrogenase Eha subunit H
LSRPQFRTGSNAVQPGFSVRLIFILTGPEKLGLVSSVNVEKALRVALPYSNMAFIALASLGEGRGPK